jgi:isoleucyl-tRNA synthetase
VLSGNGGSSKNILDMWIFARLHQLGRTVTEAMDQYDFVGATKPFLDFASDLSTWYVRRSRDRFKGEDEADKQAALSTLHEVLLVLAKLLAPFMPFLAEEIYQGVREEGAKESVHLEAWPASNESLIDETFLMQMSRARELTSLALEQRAKAQIPVRQVLARLEVPESKNPGNPDLNIVVADEVNIQEVVFVKDLEQVRLDTTITPELRELGLVRELTRHVNALRKSAGLSIGDRVEVYFETESTLLKAVIEKFAKELAHDTLSTNISFGTVTVAEERQAKVQIQDNDLLIQLK